MWPHCKCACCTPTGVVSCAVAGSTRLPSPPRSTRSISLARLFHGDALAVELQIRSSRAAYAVSSRGITVTRSHRLKERQDVEHWQRNQHKHLAESRAQLADADDSQYETAGDPIH